MNWQDEQHVALLRKAYGRPLATLTERQDRALQLYLRDVWAAGRTAGEKARRASPVKSIAGVESRRTRWFWLAMQVLASITTLIGMWEGSTTVVGSLWYLAAGVLFIAVSIKHRLHGLQLLNVPALMIEAWNLWAALT